MACVSNEDEILMIKKGVREGDPNSGYFVLPGGKLKDFEIGINNPNGRTFSAIRETWEKTGLRLFNLKPLGTILFDNGERVFPKWKNPDNFLVYLFTTNNYYGELLEESKEGIPSFVSKLDIEDLPMNPRDKEMYKWLFDGRNFSGVIYHSGKKLNLEKTFVDFF